MDDASDGAASRNEDEGLQEAVPALGEDEANEDYYDYSYS